MLLLLWLSLSAWAEEPHGAVYPEAHHGEGAKREIDSSPSPHEMSQEVLGMAGLLDQIFSNPGFSRFSPTPTSD